MPGAVVLAVAGVLVTAAAAVVLRLGSQHVRRIVREELEQEPPAHVDPASTAAPRRQLSAEEMMAWRPEHLEGRQ